MSVTAQFEEPAYQARRLRLAERSTDSPERVRDSGDDREANDRGGLFAALNSIGSTIDEIFRSLDHEWVPEYERPDLASDPSQNMRSVAEQSRPESDRDDRWSRRDRDQNDRNDRNEGIEPQTHETQWGRWRETNDRRQEEEPRLDRDRRDRQRWDELREVFESDRLALLEEKRREYERLTRELERRLSRLRNEPETTELERIIRDAYLQERERNPALRKLEERLGIELDLD